MSFARQAARVFSGAKVIKSPALNMMGVQVARALIARSLHRMRTHSHELTSELTAKGYVALENFLPVEELNEIREEAGELVRAVPPTTLDEHGPSRVQRYALDDLDPHLFSALKRWPCDKRALDIASAAERRSLRDGDGVRMLEHVVYTNSQEHDRESDLHVDTFYSTHKLWLYLDDVNPENGPLVYVPGSHALSTSRLRHDYHESRGLNAGSRRIQDDELEERGLEPRVLTCPANTLIVVNTCGYHRRSAGKPGHYRRALHMGFRFNPFAPQFIRGAERLTHHSPKATRMLELAIKGQ